MRHPDLVREIGRITAREVRVTGLDWTFSPTVAVAQDDRWGRTYESYGENPALVREYVAQYVLGLQGQPGTPEFLDPERVIATAKHFIGDGGTGHGDDRGDTRVTEAELRDIHAAGYAGALQAGVQTVMASFSSWNGERMHGHRVPAYRYSERPPGPGRVGAWGLERPRAGARLHQHILRRNHQRGPGHVHGHPTLEIVVSHHAQAGKVR